MAGQAYPDTKAKSLAKSILWTFHYKRGLATFNGTIEASDEAKAIQVAQRWCDQNSVRFLGAQVRPMVLADESILLTAADTVIVQPEIIPPKLNEALA